jgi:hypothetical protein
VVSSLCECQLARWLCIARKRQKSMRSSSRPSWQKRKPLVWSRIPRRCAWRKKLALSIIDHNGQTIDHNGQTLVVTTRFLGRDLQQCTHYGGIRREVILLSVFHTETPVPYKAKIGTGDRFVGYKLLSEPLINHL